MRKVLLLSTLLVFCFTAYGWASDISGDWTLKWTGRQGEISMDMKIAAEGENLTITATHPRFGEMTGTGTLKDNTIDMTLMSSGERKMGFNLTGTVTGNTMSGTRKFIRPSGSQGGRPSGGQGTPSSGNQGGAPSGGQGNAASGVQSGSPGGGQGGRPSGQAFSNTWTAEKK